MITQALISVSDKTGILDLARALIAMGVNILSTGGTAKLLGQHGINVVEIASYTACQEILDGRVKTLHPKVHGGILARRDCPEHMATLKQQGIPTIDMVVVNLYPFQQENTIDNIDIGGPTLLRAAAKNYQDVIVMCDPSDYQDVLHDLQTAGDLTEAKRLALAQKVFAYTAQYDEAIAHYFNSLNSAVAINEECAQPVYPATLKLCLQKVQDLRYGENPHQSAAFYRETETGEGVLANYKQLQGKDLSFNNLADANAAWECVRSFDTNACVIVKHNNPCGVATGADLLACYHQAWQTDPSAAFGGIIALNRELDGITAEAIAKQFVEVLVAPAFSAAARQIFAAKHNVRLLAIPAGHRHHRYDFKRVGGGLLVQSPDIKNISSSELRVVSQRQPTIEQLQDALFAWRVAKFVKSNAIVFCAEGSTLGIGAGQMSRIDAARIAVIKAKNAGLTLANSVVASDAFFPFRDGLDSVIDAGATCIIHPGGSMRDEEIIDATNERDVVMLLTGVRHFCH